MNKEKPKRIFVKITPGERQTFQGIVLKDWNGRNKHGHTPTLFLKDIVLQGTDNVLVESAWFNLSKGFDKNPLFVGDKIQFNARINECELREFNEGKEGHEVKSAYYKVTNPTNIEQVVKVFNSITGKIIEGTNSERNELEDSDVWYFLTDKWYPIFDDDGNYLSYDGPDVKYNFHKHSYKK